MDLNLQHKIIERKDSIYDFYYKNIGDKIRKTRLESNMTQEELAKGICSNTYISKIENNKISINQEHLNLLMERMGVLATKIGIPEQMIDYLEQSYLYFFLKDMEGYRSLYDVVKEFEFGVLNSVIQLGYLVLVEDYESATLIYRELFRYLNSLEEYGFAIFVIYGCFYNIGVKNYSEAKKLLESATNHLKNSEPLYAMYHYLKFIVYGNLYQFNLAREGLEIARTVFVSHGNCSRIMELNMYVNIFKIYENSSETIIIPKNHLAYLSPNQKNYYLLMLAECSTEHVKYLDELDQDADYYLCGLFKKAIDHYQKNEMEEYQTIKQEINHLHYSSNSNIDYYSMLKYMESSEQIYLKDYLANYVLPHVTKRQNLYFYQRIITYISNILKNKKRYKDALTYNLKFQDLKDKLQMNS